MKERRTFSGERVLETPQPDGLIPSGATIGRYVVLNHTARGAMGDVYAVSTSRLLTIPADRSP